MLQKPRAIVLVFFLVLLFLDFGSHRVTCGFLLIFGVCGHVYSGNRLMYSSIVESLLVIFGTKC